MVSHQVTNPDANIICYNCGKKGHRKSNCRSPPKTNNGRQGGQANMPNGRNQHGCAGKNSCTYCQNLLKQNPYLKIKPDTHRSIECGLNPENPAKWREMTCSKCGRKGHPTWKCWQGIRACNRGQGRKANSAEQGGKAGTSSSSSSSEIDSGCSDSDSDELTGEEKAKALAIYKASLRRKRQQKKQRKSGKAAQQDKKSKKKKKKRKKKRACMAKDHNPYAAFDSEDSECSDGSDADGEDEDEHGWSYLGTNSNGLVVRQSHSAWQQEKWESINSQEIKQHLESTLLPSESESDSEQDMPDSSEIKRHLESMLLPSESSRNRVSVI